MIDNKSTTEPMDVASDQTLHNSTTLTRQAKASLAKAKRAKNRKQKQPRPLTAEQQQANEKRLLDKRLLAIAREQKDIKTWYKLDNSALMYPMVARGPSNAVFSISVQLKKPVDPIALQYALNNVYPRFPTICGTIKMGLFWPFIDKPAAPIVVQQQNKQPCLPMKVDNKRSQIRVHYFANKISVEFFHSATDGQGGVTFVNSLLRCYFAQLGIACDKTNCYDHRDNPTLEEIRDNIPNVAVKHNPPPCPPPVRTRILKGTPIKNKTHTVIRGVCSATQLYNVAKSYGATVTELLGAIQLMGLEKLTNVTNKEDKRPIRILVPVDLRKWYNVETMRNFSNYIFFESLGGLTLEQTIAQIKEQSKRQLTDEYFRGMVSFNYNSGSNPILKFVPLWLKSKVVSMVVKGRGEGVVNCSTLSNLGRISAPPQFADHLVRYEFTFGKPPKKTNKFAVATYNDVCVITMNNAYAEKDCEKFYFRKLAELGVDLTLETEVWDEE